MQTSSEMLKSNNPSNYYIAIAKNALKCFNMNDMCIDDAAMDQHYNKLLRHLFLDEEQAIIKLMISMSKADNKESY